MTPLRKMLSAIALSVVFAAQVSGEAFDFADLSSKIFPDPPPVSLAVDATNFSRRFRIPDPTGGVWRLNFDFLLDHDEGDRIFGARTRIAFGPRTMPWGKDVRGPVISDSGARNDVLYPWRYNVDVVPGMKFADVSFEMFGKGDFRVASVQFERLPPDSSPVTVSLPFGGCFDGVFHIGAGQTGVPVFAWRTNLPDDTPLGRFGCRISIPPGFMFVDVSHADLNTLSVAAGADGGSVAVYRVLSRPPAFSRTGAERFGIAVRADCEHGSNGVMTVVAEIDGRAASEPVSLRLFSSAPVNAARVPSRYANAAYLGGAYADFPGPGNRALAKTLRAAGVTWILPDVAAVTNNRSLVQMWREEGMRRVTPDGSRFVCNGFSSADKEFCPCAFYRDDSPLRKGLKKLFKSSLAGCDGMWSNWEPYRFKGTRRLCPRCAEAEKGLSKDALERLRSSEHGRVVAAIAADVAAATDSAVGFIPGVYWPELGPGHADWASIREIRTGDYMRELAFINAFGPYVRWNMSMRYVPEPGRALAYFSVAREVMRQVEDDYTPDVRPALMAFPLGLSGMDWASKPEWLELALESFFFNGWSCTAPWSFPSGGDARFLAAFARATELAAKWEAYVWDGARADGAVRVKPRGAVHVRPWIDRTYLPSLRDVPLLQHAAWEKGGERVVAVFNFDESTSAVCDVSALSRTQTLDIPPLSCRVAFFPKLD